MSSTTNIIQKSEICANMINQWALSQEDRNLEQLLKSVAQENKGCYIFPIFTFEIPLTLNKTVFDEARTQFRSLKPGGVPIYTMFAINGDELQGHHCAAIYHKGEVTLFDPMQTSNESVYLEHFKEIARHVFMTHDIYVQPFNTDKGYTLQATGGFAHIPPQHVTEDGRGNWYESNHITFEQRKMGVDEQKYLRVTSSETQNRWSYMWCLWYIHNHMIDLDIVQTVNQHMVGIDPLIVIKNYVWNILTYTNFKKELSNVPFFNDNFQYLMLYESHNGWWRTMPYKQHFSSKNSLKDINVCLEKSWNNNVSPIS